MSSLQKTRTWWLKAGLVTALILVGIGLASIPAASARAASSASVEEVQAAFLYQFTNYVEWPKESFARTDESFVISVIGDQALHRAISGMVPEADARGRTYRVEFREDIGQADADVFGQIIFVDGDDPVDTLRALEERLEGLSLTVGVDEEFTRSGGIIRLYRDDSRIRIEVNIDAARRTNLKISSKLLGLARIVEDEST